jgi:hypothetical protein
MSDVSDEAVLGYLRSRGVYVKTLRAWTAECPEHLAWLNEAKKGRMNGLPEQPSRRIISIQYDPDAAQNTVDLYETRETAPESRSPGVQHPVQHTPFVS